MINSVDKTKLLARAWPRSLVGKKNRDQYSTGEIYREIHLFPKKQEDPRFQGASFFPTRNGWELCHYGL